MISSRAGSIAGGICGIAGGLLFFAALGLAPPPPALGAAANEIVRYYAENHRAALIAAFVFAASTPFLLTWTGALAGRLRDAEGPGAWLYLVFLGGGIGYSTIATSVSFIWMALAARGWSAGEGVAQTLSDFTNYGYVFIGFGALVFVGAAAVVMIRTGEVARTLGLLGLIVAALLILYLSTALFTDGLMAGGGAVTIAGFVALGLWLFGVSAMMLVRAPAGPGKGKYEHNAL
jgi:hypothetical protein